MAAILVAKNKSIFLLVKMPRKMSYALTTNMVAFLTLWDVVADQDWIQFNQGQRLLILSVFKNSANIEQYNSQQRKQ